MGTAFCGVPMIDFSALHQLLPTWGSAVSVDIINRVLLVSLLVLSRGYKLGRTLCILHRVRQNSLTESLYWDSIEYVCEQVDPGISD